MIRYGGKGLDWVGSWLCWLTGSGWTSDRAPDSRSRQWADARRLELEKYFNIKTAEELIAKIMKLPKRCWLAISSLTAGWNLWSILTKYVLIILGQAANGRICINHRFMRDFLTWRYLTPTIYIMDNIVMMTKLGTSTARSVFLAPKTKREGGWGGLLYIWQEAQL